MPRSGSLVRDKQLSQQWEISEISSQCSWLQITALTDRLAGRAPAHQRAPPLLPASSSSSRFLQVFILLLSGPGFVMLWRISQFSICLSTGRHGVNPLENRFCYKLRLPSRRIAYRVSWWLEAPKPVWYCPMLPAYIIINLWVLWYFLMQLYTGFKWPWGALGYVSQGK